MVIGGQAVLLYGEPRLTRDIDITLGVGPDSLDTLKRIIQTLALKILVKDLDGFARETLVVPTLDEESRLRVDFIFAYSPYERQAIRRAKAVMIGKATVRFASREDVIIHKVVAGRPRDLDDVRGILLKKVDFDKRYTRKWLKVFGETLKEDLVGKLKKALEEVEK
jgi:hypothetical protein